LGIKPWLDEGKCRRIGKASPKKLLVSLNSEQAAADLITAAKQCLSQLDKNVTESMVYFNHDLSPQEAEKEYLKRKERTERIASRGNGTIATGTTSATTQVNYMNNISSGATSMPSSTFLNPEAQPFPSTTC